MACTWGASSPPLDTLAHCYTPHCTPRSSPSPIKGRSRALLQRVGRAGKDGTALAQGRSLPPAWTLVTPYCKRTRPGRGTNTKAAGFHLSRPSPSSFFPLRAPSRADPSGLGHAATFSLVGPGTPPVSKRRHSLCQPLINFYTNQLVIFMSSFISIHQVYSKGFSSLNQIFVRNYKSYACLRLLD